MEHRKRGMGSIGDLFSGPAGLGDALGLDPESWGAGVDLVAAAAAGGIGVKAMRKVETYYPNMIKARAWATPLIRTGLGVGAGLGFSMTKFPGSRALALGLGVVLTADGMLDLFTIAKARLMSKGVNGIGQSDELLYGNGVNGAPIDIREESLAGAPLSIRDVSDTEQQLSDFAYLQ